MTIRRISSLDDHLDAAGRIRERSSELAEGIERLLGKFSELPNVPLDVLDRVERAIVGSHTSNLLRLTGEHRPSPPAPPWAVGGLHDLACTGPDAESGCVCKPTYMRRLR